MNFFVVGPTAVGKSRLAVELAQRVDGEIVNADPFQMYRGLDLLTAKPEPALRALVPHHLLGMVPLSVALSAAKFRDLASPVLKEIAARNKHALIVSGSGLYLRALTDGFDIDTPPNMQLREELESLTSEQLASRLRELDPQVAETIDLKNPRRLIRALEIVSDRRGAAEEPHSEKPRGVFLTRERDELYERINARIEEMFAQDVEAEVHRLTETGPTAEKALGLREIRDRLAGRSARHDCIAKIQQATRQYAKRQLTWFRHQTTFPQLNLTALSQENAVSAIVKIFAQG